MTLDEIASVYLSHMSLDDKLGQLFVVALSDTDYNATNAAMVEQMHAGAIILYAANMVSKDQTRKLITTAQAHATLPLLVLTDEEGGWVDRLVQLYGWRPSASDIGATDNPKYATAQGLQTGKDMRALGFNADFAPDVDVQLVNGPDQMTRTFGTTPEGVTKMAGAYLTGMQQAGIVVCLKHFPGLGAAKVDAHRDLPKIDRTLDQIESVELAPYRNLIGTGQVQMIMSTDLLMPAIDPTLPAELSPAIITGVLRDELGFNGVVVTDALYMEGIAKKYSMATAAVMAIEAGNDMLEGAFSAYSVRDMKQAILAAMSQGDITPQRIDESVRRILLLKMRMGILPIPAGVAPVTPLGSMVPTVVDGPLALAPKG
jgi:beta-N-acetylhexosaminidase